MMTFPLSSLLRQEVKPLHFQLASNQAKANPFKFRDGLQADTVSFQASSIRPTLNSTLANIRKELETTLGKDHVLFTERPGPEDYEALKQVDMSAVFTPKMEQLLDDLSNLMIESHAKDVKRYFKPCKGLSEDALLHNFRLKDVSEKPIIEKMRAEYPNIEKPEDLLKGKLKGVFRHVTSSQDKLESILKDNFNPRVSAAFMKTFGNGTYFTQKQEDPSYFPAIHKELHRIDATIEAENACFLDNHRYDWPDFPNTLSREIGQADCIGDRADLLKNMLTAEVLRKIVVNLGYDALIASGEIVIPDSSVIKNVAYVGRAQ